MRDRMVQLSLYYQNSPSASNPPEGMANREIRLTQIIPLDFGDNLDLLSKAASGSESSPNVQLSAISLFSDSSTI
jgi:hypothetical protein